MHLMNPLKRKVMVRRYTTRSQNQILCGEGNRRPVGRTLRKASVVASGRLKGSLRETNNLVSRDGFERSL